MSMRRFVMAKLVYAGLPLLVMGEFLVIVSNYLLDAAPLYRWLGVVVVALMGPGTAALALGMGARSPDFKADNAARLAASPGAILYMVIASLYVGGVLFLCAWPIMMQRWARWNNRELGAGYIWITVAFFAAAFLVAVVVPAWTLITGADSLAKAEQA